MTWLFRRTDESTFESSEYTRTGWNETDQHGGPPSALLAHVIQGMNLPAPMQMSRITVSLMRPVPIAPLRVQTRVVRAGRRVAVVEADLFPLDTNDPVATSQAQMIRTEEVPLGEVPRPEFEMPTPPLHHPEVPVGGTGGGWMDSSVPRFHIDGLEKRSVDRGWETHGPGVAWFRLLHQVVDGEEALPTTKFVAISDTANGLSQVLNAEEFMWINPDLTVAFSRHPAGEWFGMRAAADPQTHGVGLVHATAFDEGGTFGHVLQSQLLIHHP